MRCPYCTNEIRLVNWADHSQACSAKKNVRSILYPDTEGDLPKATTPIQPDEYDEPPPLGFLLDNMTAQELKHYMNDHDIEYEERWRKPRLLKAAKGK